MSSPLLKVHRPDLFGQLDTERNSETNLDALTCGSQLTLWWYCTASGQSWQATPKNRCGSPSSKSPFVLNKRLAMGFNDVLTVRPDLAAQWSPNNTASPRETIIASKYRVEWVCPETGFRWKESPASRNRKTHTDSPAQRGKAVVPGYNDLAGAVPDVVAAWDPRNRTSPDLVYARSTSVLYLRDPATGATWEDTARAVTIRGTVTPHKLVVGLNDLATVHPELAEQLDPLLDARDYTAHSNEKVTWVCPETGRKWDALIANRVKTGLRSPFQTRRRVMTGSTDLLTLRPGLAAQMVTEADPSRIPLKSNRKVIWKCPVYGIEWEETVARRTSRGGDDSPFVRGARAVKGVTDLFTAHPELRELWSTDNHVDGSDLLPRSHREVKWRCPQRHTWRARVADVARTDGKATRCPQCYAESTASTVEADVCAYIESLGVTVQRQNSEVIPGRRVDLYLPDHDLVVEVYGTYWHREQFAGRDSHRERAASAVRAGARFLVIWEDDWIFRTDIVKSHLRHLTGTAARGVFARSTVVKELRYPDVADFLNTYHIQGAGARSAKFFGLEHSGELVAVSAWSRSGNALTLHRYATSRHVVGGMGKLLAFASAYARAHGLSEVVTFSDNEVSRGDMYRTLGFTLDRKIPPDYRYVIGNRRVHKSAYRLSRFRTDPNLTYVSGAAERELADLNNIPRVWDSGKLRWVLNIRGATAVPRDSDLLAL